MSKEYTYKYPMPSITADVIAYKLCKDHEPMKILVVKRKNEPFKGKYAFPGGFVDPTERVDHAASRELMEETGINVPSHKLEFQTFLDNPKRDPRNRTISFVYSKLLPDDAVPVAGDDAAEAEFKSLSELNSENMAFDHYSVLFWFCHKSY